MYRPVDVYSLLYTFSGVPHAAPPGKKVTSSRAMADPVQLKASIGFNGRVLQGLFSTLEETYLISPSGSAVVIRNFATNEQILLRGHDCTVTCTALSPSGRYLASGQQTYKGFVADVVLWDLKCYRELARLR